ncbi:hypothetical protein Tco_1579062 [Tanacetum coccineum]
MQAHLPRSLMEQALFISLIPNSKIRWILLNPQMSLNLSFTKESCERSLKGALTFSPQATSEDNASSLASIIDGTSFVHILDSKLEDKVDTLRPSNVLKFELVIKLSKIRLVG